MGLINTNLYTDVQNTLAQTFAICSHAGRIKIILMLLVNKHLTLKEIKLEIGLSQSATSDLVRILKNAGVIKGTKVGNSIWYELNSDIWNGMKFHLQVFLDEVGQYE